MDSAATSHRGRTMRWCVSGAALFLAGCATPGRQEQFAAQLRAHPTQGVLIDHVPDRPAADSRGALAALADLMTFWGHPMSVAEAHRLFDEQAPTWGDAPALALVAQKNGCWSHARKASVDELKERLRAGVPVLVDLPIDPRKPNWRRFSLVVGFDDARNMYLSNDGHVEPVERSARVFEQWWHYTGYWMMTVCPPERAAWTLRADEYLSRGRFYEMQGRLQDARDDYHRAAELDPADSSALVCLANVERRGGHSDDAELAYRKALEVRPDDSKAMNNLAYLLAERGTQLTEAETLARNALLLEPTNPGALDTLGFVLSRAGQWGEAVHFLEQARARSTRLAKADQREIAVHLAQAYKAAGHAELAAELVAELRKADAKFPLPADLQPLVTPP